MKILVWMGLIGLLAALVDNVIVYLHAKGTVMQRLAACWAGSLTLVIGVYGTLVAGAMYGLDALGAVTGDPAFTQFADAVKAAIPAQYHPWVPVGALFATMLGRLRTLRR